ncbi:anhydro-N-acetylmuramic acid kinase [Psychromonas sp. 14N.309.X.WAT.B.A12]|uniref:anhydro-N-acetylmuramic acid kinase n=1 Tax=unclassified Psychromonas TaxID=2614957 RepID=UPI0025B128C4|nr:anhydro-N-acetylmuramic acid kinase [Psychromonas sp. 14N.309.X.WAT.B.A12]MDN2664079.1 anhydro-N-acetylmuramic acid kinase [Psychromonas sp. 14N.309.X.WAT.B.A12]
MSNVPGLYLGLMSGTSLDAIDVALCERNEEGFIQIAGTAIELAPELRQQLLSICNEKHASLHQLGEVDHQFAVACAQAVNSLLKNENIQATSVSAIGSHGQTIYHSPDTKIAFTQQIGDANVIAAQTQIPCIADFRRMDMAYGGQGAPLVPAFHQALFAKSGEQRIILNIGGIANISVLNGTEHAFGYDTGPGNMLMDAWINLHHQQTYDKNAWFASSGIVNQSLLNLLLADPYFALAAPKSTGREKFNLSWLTEQIAKQNYQVQDVQRTLLEFTALTIVDQIKLQSKGGTVYVCGGGALNPLLMGRLSALLVNHQVHTTDALAINPMYVEAVAFAWLAEQRMLERKVPLKAVTGASRDAILGCIYLP